MAESTLTLCYVELKSAVSYFLFGNTDPGQLSSQEQDICDECVQSGYRAFLYPPAIEGVEAGYEWTFMRPVSSIDTVADTADQDMPENFDRLVGNGFTFAANAQVAPVVADVGEGRIRNLRLAGTETGRPRVAGLRRKNNEGAEAQRWEVMWYPTPDAVYTLEFRFAVLVEALTETDEKVYPLGGLKHADTLRASCLAAADARVNDMYDGPKYQDFIRRLIGSIKRDKGESAKFFGEVGSQGQYENSSSHFGVYSNYTLSVGGTQIHPAS
jgi:hypothetical protein